MTRHLAVLAIAVATAACTPPAATVPSARTPASMFVDAREKGVPFEDPLALDDDMKAAVDSIIPKYEPEFMRVRNLATFIRTSLEFDYQSNLTLTAREAFHQRRGDCMAFTHLFVALARHLDIPAYFVHVDEVRNFYERRGSFFVSSHVAAGVGKGPTAIVIDFAKQIPDWKLSIYEATDDVGAIALYYNNVAVDEMLAGKMDEAEKLMRFLLSWQPKVPEIYNNLAVILNRRERYDESIAVVQKGLELFPGYEPLFTNGIRAAHGAKRPDLEQDLDRRGQALADKDPYFLFAEALRLFQDKRYKQSIEKFERATTAKPDSAVMWAWLSRAYIVTGNQKDAASAYARAKQIEPGAPAVKDLVSDFPELAVHD